MGNLKIPVKKNAEEKGKRRRFMGHEREEEKKEK